MVRVMVVSTGMVYFGTGDEGARCETRNLAEHGNMAERI